MSFFSRCHNNNKEEGEWHVNNHSVEILVWNCRHTSWEGVSLIKAIVMVSKIMLLNMTLVQAPLWVEMCAGMKQVWVRDNNTVTALDQHSLFGAVLNWQSLFELQEKLWNIIEYLTWNWVIIHSCGNVYGHKTIDSNDIQTGCRRIYPKIVWELTQLVTRFESSNVIVLAQWALCWLCTGSWTDHNVNEKRKEPREIQLRVWTNRIKYVMRIY